MISRDAAPTAHTPPLKRVDLGARPPGDPNASPIADMSYSPAECARIWELVRQTATGTNPPVVEVVIGMDFADAPSVTLKVRLPEFKWRYVSEAEINTMPNSLLDEVPFAPVDAAPMTLAQYAATIDLESA